MTKTHHDLDAILQLLQEVCSVYGLRACGRYTGLMAGAVKNKLPVKY